MDSLPAVMWVISMRKGPELQLCVQGPGCGHEASRAQIGSALGPSGQRPQSGKQGAGHRTAYSGAGR
jgi:hypothetical protein